MFFKYIIKNTFSNCHQTLKQIAMGLPLSAAYYTSFLLYTVYIVYFA